MRHHLYSKRIGSAVVSGALLLTALPTDAWRGWQKVQQLVGRCKAKWDAARYVPSSSIPQFVLAQMAGTGFEVHRSSDSKAVVVTGPHAGVMLRERNVAKAITAMTGFVEGLVRAGRKIRNQCFSLPGEACDKGVADHLIEMPDVHTKGIDWHHFIAGKRINSLWGKILVAFDPIARANIFDGESPRPETLAFVARSADELARMLKAFYASSTVTPRVRSHLGP